MSDQPAIGATVLVAMIIRGENVQLPMIVTHTNDDGTVNGVVLSGKGGDFGGKPYYPMVHVPRGEGNRQWLPMGDVVMTVKEGILALDPNDKSLWIKGSGKPKVEAIEAVIGRDISAGDRDAALAEIEAEREAA